MNGVGPLGHGGSFSSSSNLSHLAPPFTVDSYCPIPNNTSSLGHAESSLPELRDSYFGNYPYNAFQSWVPSPIDVSLGIHAVSDHAFASWAPSPTDVSLGIHAVSNNASASWVPSPTDVSLGIHAVPYHPASSVGHTTTLTPGTHQILGSHRTGVSSASSSHYNLSPYYPQKPSVSVREHSGYVCDGRGNALPTTWFPPDSPVSPVWNGENAGEQWKGNDRPSYASLVNQASSAADRKPSREKLCKIWAGRSVEPLAGKSSVESQCTSFPVGKLSSVSDGSTRDTFSELSRASVSNTASLQKMPYQQETSPDLVMESRSQLNIGAASYDGCFPGVGSYKTDPLSFYSVYSKPSLDKIYDSPSIIGTSDKIYDSPSIIGTSTTRLKGTLLTNMTPIERPTESYYGKEASVNHDASDTGYLPVNAESSDVYGDTSSIKNTVEKDTRIYVDTSMLKIKCSSPSTGDPLTNLIDAKNKMRDAEFGFPATTSVTTEMGASDSIKHSSDVLEQYNLGVDSPCWKGASDSRYSLFGPAEAGFTDIPAKLSQGCNSFNLFGSQNLPVNSVKAVPSSPYDTQRNKKCSAIDGSSFPKQPSPVVSLSSGDHCPNTGEVKVDHLELSNKNMIPCSVSSNVDGGSGLEPPQTSKFSYHEGNAASSPFFSEVKTVDPAVDVNVAADVGTNWQPHHLCDYSSLPSYYSSYPSLGGNIPLITDLTEPLLARNTFTESQLSRVDVEKVVSSIHRLSVLLLSYCSNFEDPLREHEHVVVQEVVQNLETCISAFGTMKSTPETEFLQPKMSCCLGKQTNVNKVTVTARSQATNPKITDVQSRCDTSKAREEKKNPDILKKNEDHSPILAFSRGNPVLEQENMTKSIKEILEENVHGEEELDQQCLLYKNLWLEAEAALCSVKYKERFARMKIEMEKCKNPVKGEPIDVEKLPSPKITREPNGDDLVESTSNRSEHSEVRNVAMQDTSQSDTAGTAEDTCASMMARFHILKSRMNSETPIDKEQPHDAISDGVHAEIEQRVSYPTSLIAEDIVLKPQQPKIINLCSANGRKPWPFIRDKLELRTIPSIDNYSKDQPCSSSDVSEQQDLVEFGPLQFAATNLLVDQFSSGDCVSPSSDWEHVLKEAAWPA